MQAHSVLIDAVERVRALAAVAVFDDVVHQWGRGYGAGAICQLNSALCLTPREHRRVLGSSVQGMVRGVAEQRPQEGGSGRLSAVSARKPKMSSV